MTNLTDKWKKGELPSGWYYVRLIRGEYRIDLYINGKNEWIDCPDNIIDTVVCEVPSYEQWQEYKDANDSMFDTIKMLNKDNYKLEKENTKLKELLKECRDEIGYLRKHYKGNIDNFKNNTRLDKEINQVLGEE